jgi:phage host-nuclease inhibitor protein Gam
VSVDEPSLGELGRLIRALRDDVRDDMAQINQRLDKLVSADVYAVEKAAMVKEITELTKAVQQLAAKQEQDVRAIADQRIQDVNRVTQTRRWIVASVIIPILGFVVPIVLFLASGGGS